jgi:hypothetical protein
MSTPLHLPLVAMLNVLPQRLSADDSLARMRYVRRRVKTIVMLQAGRTDTTEYTTLDRQGNKTLIAKPYFGQHRRQRFDARNRLVEVTMVPKANEYPGSQTVYDPGSQVYTTTALGVEDQPLLWQQAQQTRQGDTLTTDALFQPLPGMADMQARQRLRLRSYPLGRDTTCSLAVAYDAADHPTEFSAGYTVKQAGRVVETGMLDYRPTPLAAPVAAAEQLRLMRYRRPRFVPGNRYEYDKRGLLLRSSYIADPNAVPAKPVTSSAADGSWSMSRGVETRLLGYSTYYLRNPDGQVKREERSYQLRPGTDDAVGLQMFRPSAIDYEYDSRGLLLRKTDTAGLVGKPQVYQVKYTYY